MKKILLLLIALIFNTFFSYSQICGSDFTDSGGSTGNYHNNENITYTICPSASNEIVTVTFTSFSTETTFDGLYVFDGNSVNAPQISSTNGYGNLYLADLPGAFWGTTIPGPFTSTSPDGCLTFKFMSDSSVTPSGWVANVTCDSADRIVLKAFVDSNNNGIKDVGEMNFNHGSFLYDINNSGTNTNAFSPTGNYIITDSNASNSYSFSYALQPEYASYYDSGTTSYNNITITPGSGTQILYFPIQQTQAYNDVSISFVPLNSPKPGHNYLNKIIYKNNGTTTASSGTITFVKPNALTLVSVTQVGATTNATGFTYNYTNLLPNETRTSYVNLSVPAIPTVNINDVLTANASITSPPIDFDLTNNSSSLSQIVVASLDPNDKIESHGGSIVFNQFTSTDYLYYTIRFENTGTAPAENIRIEDVLDSKLDETSIRMISASNDYLLDRAGSNLSWKFNNIQLPVSVPDTETGKGYVTFKIKPKPGYAIGDIIPNTASIYFDTNPAIVTNTFNTEFISNLSTPTFEEGVFTLYPNPAHDKITIHLNRNSDAISSITIYNLLGSRIFDSKGNSSDTITMDISTLPKGIYTVEISTDSGFKQNKKIIVK